ncbi:hypothetical protein DFJ77DRAFT_325264 [Powellomyces hirtus]|nr:hypothetical protein DFJ77DRAFT_325264 [Powellomyces hirtus]
MALIPRVQESLRFSAIDKVRRKQAQHGRATEEGTDHNLIIPRRSSWADMDGVRGWGVLRRAIGHHIAKWSSKVGLGTRDTLLSTGPLDSGGCLEPAGKRNASSNLISMQQQKLQTTKQQDYAVALSKILDTGMEGDDPAVQMGSQPLNLPMSLFSADGSTEPSVGGRRPDGNRFVDRNASGLLKRPGTVSLNPTRDLDMTLANPASLAALSQFAAHEYCVENLLFLAAAEDFRSRVARLVGSNSRSGAQYHATADDRLSCASHIMDAFITPGSMNEINLPSYVRTETEKRFRKAKEPGSDSLPGNIFDECVEHVK